MDEIVLMMMMLMMKKVMIVEITELTLMIWIDAVGDEKRLDIVIKGSAQ